MKKIAITLLSIGLFFSIPVYGQYSSTGSDGSDTGNDEVATLMKNWATWVGYNIEKPTETSPVFSLLNYTYSLATTGQQMLNVFFAARLLNPTFKEYSTNSAYSVFNKQANTLFTNFKTPSTKTISVVEDFDQKAYQDDPVNQMLRNILGTPNTDTCADNSDECKSKSKVMYTVLQDIVSGSSDEKTLAFPSETTYYDNDHVSKYLSQLNSANLIGPLMYSEEGDQKSVGLPSGNQELQAMDFVRYVTAAVLPNDFMSGSDYSSLWQQAQKEITSSTSPDDKTAIQAARKDLMSYLLKSRVYTAQSSVPINNLVDIMTKRLPQKVTSSDGSTSTSTSQAFNEFVMATWRLYSPGITSTDEQWVNQINTASAATTQKEIAILLSEINYQMYLSRQIQERILLTNSIIALNSLANNQPSSLATTTVTTGATGP